jgi:hypothetical protein
MSTLCLTVSSDQDLAAVATTTTTTTTNIKNNNLIYLA